MKHLITSLIAATATGLLLSCARPAMTPKKDVSPANEKIATKKSQTQSQTIGESGTAHGEATNDLHPAPQPDRGRGIKRTRTMTRDSGGKPLEADMGDMPSDSTTVPMVARVIMIQNISSSDVMEFHKKVLLELRRQHCDEDTGNEGNRFTVIFGDKDHIRVEGLVGQRAKCVRSAFSAIAPWSLAHRDHDSEPIRVKAAFPAR